MDEEPYQEQRQSSVFVAYVLIVCTVCFLFVFAFCGGMAIYMALVALGVTAVGFCHYFFWGHSMSQSAAGAHEDAEVVESVEKAEENPYRERY